MRTRGIPRLIGVPGPHLCRYDLPEERPARHKCRPGSLGERLEVSSPGYEGGRRRAIGVVAALPETHARPRRWCGAGSPGRQSVTAGRKAGVEDRVRDSVRNQRQESATGTLISDRCALLGPMFMVTSGSFRGGRVVDGIPGVKG